MRLRVIAAALAVTCLALAVACRGGVLGKQYEYEEDLTLDIDGSATLIVNASLPALVALRGLEVPTDPSARIDRDEIRALYDSPASDVRRVSRPWRRNGRRFVQIRVEVPDVRQLHEVAPFGWSRYEFREHENGYLYRQTVGASALKPGTLQNFGWDGSEIVAFRLHLPSRITFHNARDIETNAPSGISRGNILSWEQHLADRLDGQPVEIEVQMQGESILYQTLWLFAGAFTAAVLLLASLVWWTVRKGSRMPNAECRMPKMDAEVFTGGKMLAPAPSPSARS